MNYRHAFHAGNFADVFKHTVLVGLLDALEAKPAAFCYVDTHAGRGRYDLRGSEAARTGEASDGVRRLVGASLPPALQRYMDLVRSFNADGALTTYPGSPMLAARVMREQDRAIVCDKHPEEAAALRMALAGDRRFAIHQRDGYEAPGALLPPAQKRGLVLVDPPFEAQAMEFAAIQQALARSLQRWPGAIHAIWYPIKLRDPVQPFHRWLRSHAGAADVLVAELLLHPANSLLRLNGCGMAILNPPWRFDTVLETWLPTLGTLLAQGTGGEQHVTWLKTA